MPLFLKRGLLVNSIYNYPQTVTFSTSDRLEIGDIPFISHNPKPTRAEALEYYRRVTSTSSNIKLYEGVERLKKSPKGLSLKRLKQLMKQKTSCCQQASMTGSIC